MLAYIKEGKAKLYSGALETLEDLKTQGYRLIFLSNCKIAYMDAQSSMILLLNMKYLSILNDIKRDKKILDLGSA